MQNGHDFTPCIKALSGAFVLSKKALQVEIAVAFIVFHDIGSTNVSAKKALRQVYADAGRRDCMTPDSPAYQTVIRRVNRTAALFEAIGWRKIKRALKDVAQEAAIQVVIDLIEPMNLETMDDVAAHAGKPRKEPVTVEGGDEDVEVIHVKTRHIDVVVPPGTPPRELIALANKLLALAEKMATEVAT